MKTVTLLCICTLTFFSASLWAKPSLPSYSTAEDTLAIVEHIAPENGAPVEVSSKKAEVCCPSFVIIDDLCGLEQGAINLTPDIGSPGPYLYMWSNGETTEDISGLAPGVYTVSIFDSNNQLQIGMAVVGEFPPLAPLAIDGVVTGSSLCNGSSNGAIDLTVDPLPNSWNYTWSNGETTMDVMDLPPGTYTVSVTWGVTCTTTETFIVPNLTNSPTLIPPIGGFGLDFCETSNGWAAIQAVGGTAPYTYEWSNGETDFQIMDLVAGDYTVTVTGADGCSATYSGPVNPGTLDVTVVENVITPNTTCNGANGAISITVGPSGAWLPTATFLWSNGETTQNLSNLTSGSYRVTVTRLGICTATEVWYVEDEPILPSLSFINTSSTCGLSNGGVNMTILPGAVAPFSYIWSNGATTEDLTNIVAGTYDVTLTSANGCTSIGSTTVEDNQATFTYNATATDQTSCDTINGRVNLSIFPSNLAYTWSNGATTLNLNPVGPGDYTVTISAGGTCTAVETITVGDIREYPSIPALIDTTTCGLSNGGIDLMVLGNAVGPFTYLWSNGATTQDLTNIKADTFFVTVTSAVGCSNQNSFIVPNFNDTIRIQSNVIDNFSCLAPTGVIDLNITPLDTAYVFVWSSGQTTDSLYNLTAGDYLVTVTLGLTCTALDTFTVINNALPPNLASSSTAANCSLNNGAADLSVSSGTGPFTYLWSNADTTEDLVNLAPGTYTVTVTGSNSCTAETVVNVLNNGIALNVNGTPSNNTSCLAANGSIDVGVTPTGAYAYAWSNAETTEDLNNLAPGTYTVTVSLGTCLSSNTFTIIEDAFPPNLSTLGTASDCGLPIGAADLSVAGGTGPFTYLWSNTEITEDLSGLTPGTYTVTVTGSNACTSSSSAVVADNNIVLNINAIPAGNTSCTVPNGALDINVTPAGTYTYNWSNAAGTEDLIDLDAGTYTVTVSFGTCQSSSTFQVADNTLTPALTPSITASICGVNNGAIDLSVGGPSGPYTYLWSNMETTEDLVTLLPGTYTVTVTAANGCTTVEAINVANNASTFSLAAAPAPLTDCATNNGAIDLNVTPAGAFTYLWSNMETTEDLSGLAPGTYTVSVTQSGSCTATASYFVMDQRTNPTTAQSIVPELCGQSDGSIDLSVNGGTGPFIFQWDSGQASEDLFNITAGTYLVTVTDVNNCTATSSATIPGNSISFALASNPSANSSCIVTNGAIDLTVNPGGPGYTFDWSSGETTEDLSGINAGTYTVTVSAGGNCTNTAVVTVTSNIPTPILAQNITTDFCGQSDGSIDLTVSGSPAPHQFSWSNGAMTEDLVGITAATYSVTVTAANGCSTVDNFVVPDNVFVPSIASTLSPATSCVSNNGAIDLTINPPMAYTFNWSNGSMTEDLNNIAAGIYVVTVSGGGTCTNTVSLTVNSNTGMVTLSGTPSSILCFGNNTGAIDLSVNTGTAPFVYNWSPTIPGNPQDPSGLSAGTYTVTVTDDQGCTSTAVFSVTQPASALQLQCSVTNLVSQTGLTDGAAAVDIAGGTGPYAVTWSPGSSQSGVNAGNFPITNLGENTYGVTVTDANGCPITCGFSVGVSACATAVGSMSNALITACGADCITATYNTNGQVLNNNDGLQFVLHTGNGATIVNEIARAAQPSFCFDPGTMSFGTTYYISALAGVTDASGNVVLSGNCTVNSAGTPIRFNETPLASASVPASINCQTPQTALQGSSSISGSTFLWSTVNGTLVGNPAQANTTASEAGDYNLVVTANGCSDTTLVTVSGNFTQPQVAVNAPNTLLDCSTQSLAITGTISGSSNASSTWVLNGAIVGNGTSLAVNAPGQYYFVAVDALSFCADTSSITITQSINPPALTIANPVVLTCTTPAQTLTGSSSVNGVQFAWATISGTDTTLVGNGSTLSVSTPGTYYLFGVNPANNCPNAVSVNISANQTPPVADAGAPFTLDCAGETAGLNGSGSGAPNLSYQWTTVDGSFVSGANSATPLIDLAGTYVLAVTNPANGCSATDEVIILPEVPIAFASVIQPTCQGEPGIIVVDSVTGLSDPIVYRLNNSQPSTSNQFSNLNPGVYNIQVEGGNGCSATAVVTVEPPVSVDITLVPEAEIDLGYFYQIDATVNIPNSDIASITWTPSAGLSCDSCLSTTAMPNSSTNYEILVVSKVGCEARGNIKLIVDETKKVYGPNIFSPDDDGKNDVFTIFADPISVLKVKSLKVYSRWGEQVFEQLDFVPGDIGGGWDGTFKGQNLNPAVFIWQASVLFVDGKEEIFTGDVTLQR